MVLSSKKTMMSLVFLGTGASCAIPVVGHLNHGTSCVCKDAMNNPNSMNCRNNVSLLIHLPKETVQDAYFNTRSTGEDLGEGGIAEGKLEGGYSGTSNENGKDINVLIDCGKTFRNGYFRVLASRRIHYVDALLLTHGHSDAMQGIGDLCELHAGARRELCCSAHLPTTVGSDPARPTIKGCVNPLRETADAPLKAQPLNEPSVLLPPVLHQGQIPTYLTDLTFENIEALLPGLMPLSRKMGPAPTNATAYWQRVKAPPSLALPMLSQGEGNGGCDRPVGLDLFVLPEEATMPLYVEALDGLIPMYSLPVEHGKDYISLGYVFGRGTAFKSQPAGDAGASLTAPNRTKEKSCVVYISDISSIPETSMNFLLDLVKIDVLIFDLLTGKGESSMSHTCWDDIMPYLRLLTPMQTFFVGMFCSLEHHASNFRWEIDMTKEKERVKELLRISQSSSQKFTSSFSDAADGIAKGGILEELHCAGESCKDRKARWMRFLSISTPKLAYDGLEVPLPL